NADVDIKVHSCGDYSPIMQDEIDMGVNLSGLMQPVGGNRDQATMKSKFGDKIAMIGGLDVQRLLPRGQVEEGREGVLNVMKNLAVGGGYNLSPPPYILADLPVPNNFAMIGALEEFGLDRKHPPNHA